MSSPEPKKAAPAEQVAQALREVIANVVIHNVRVAEEVGLAPRDMQAIHLLQLRGALTPGEIGAAVGLASGGTTALLDRLERAGYIRRERDIEDRRRVLIHLDEVRLGRDLAPRYREQAEHLAGVIARYNERELRVIAKFLAALAESDAE